MSWPSLTIVRPITIGDAQLTSSNVPEAAPADWSNATTYALNQQASIDSVAEEFAIQGRKEVYQSLQNGNTNHTPPNATWWSLVGYTYEAYNAAAIYQQGTRVVEATEHLVYEALQVAIGVPLNSPDYWAVVGPTNKWAMFDASNTTRSEAERQIVVVLALTSRADSVSLFNLDAGTARIQSAQSGYDETYDLTETSGIDDWYAWFFEPVVRKQQLIVTDLPAYLSQTITVTIDNGTATAAAGNMVVGQTFDTGITLAGVDIGIVDYSRKEVDQWGTYSLVARAFAKKMSLQAVVENGDVDRVGRLLEEYRATATVWRGSADFSSLGLFGFFRNFSIAFSYPTQSVCSLELEGLT